jgi:glycogen operon protein
MSDGGEPIRGETLLLLINSHWEEVPFKLPTTSEGMVWETLVDTRDPNAPVRICRGGETFPLFGRSLAVLAAVMPQDAAADTARGAALGGEPQRAAGTP